MRYGEQAALGKASHCARGLRPTPASLGAPGDRLLCLQDASTRLLGNKRVTQPIRVTFEREQVGCQETGRAVRSRQLSPAPGPLLSLLRAGLT